MFIPTTEMMSCAHARSQDTEQNVRAAILFDERAREAFFGKRSKEFLTAAEQLT